MHPLTRPTLTRTHTIALALLAGVFMALGYAPINAWPFSLCGMALFTWLMAGRSLKAAAGYGYLAGLSYHVLTLHWIAVLGVPIAAALIAFVSLWCAAAGMLISRMTALRGWIATVPAVWVSIELLCGLVPFGGFPWLRLGHTALDQPISGWFPIVGSAGVTYLVVFTAQALLLVVMRVRNPRLGAWWVLVLALLAPFITGGALTWLPHDQPAQSVRIGVVQGNVNRAEHGTGTYARSVTANHLSETIFMVAQHRVADDAPLDFIVWPENATDTDPITDPVARRSVEHALQLAQTPILVGAVMDGPVPDSRQTTGLWWSADGPGEQYNKRNLVPFGEWIPFRDVLLPLLPILEQTGRQSIPGETPGVIRTPVARYPDLVVGDIICFELAWDSTVFETITHGGQVLVSQSNTNTYGGTTQVYQQLALNRVRAKETGREIVVATLNSISGVVDVHGTFHQGTQEFTSAHRFVEVPLRTNTTWAVHLTPWLSYVCAAVVLVALAWGHRSRHGTELHSAPSQTE